MEEVSRGDLIRMMVGRELSAVFPKTFVEPGEVVLEVEDLGCRAAGVRNVSLSVRAGEILGLAGLVGAGRTELARVLFGLTPADTGEVRLRGRPVAIDSPTRAAALGIAYVPEDRRRHGVILDMTTAANTTLATLRAVSRFGFLDFRARARHRRAVRPAARDQDALARNARGQPLGRQPAEGGAGSLAGGEARAADPRRADPGGRRRRQGRDPPAHERAGRARAGDLDDLIRVARDSRHERPDRRDARRHDRRHVSTARAPPKRRSSSWRSGTYRGAPASASDRTRLEGRAKSRAPHDRPVSSRAVGRHGLCRVAAHPGDRRPAIFSRDSLRAFVVSNAPVLVAAVGMTLVILCRQIDISIGSIFSICGVVAGLLAEAGLPIVLVGLGTLVAGSGLGAINGALVARLGLPSIVVTLATLVIGRESLRYMREGEFVRNLPPGFSGSERDRRPGNGWSWRSRSWSSRRLPGACVTWRWAGRSTRRARTPRPPGWRASGLAASFSACSSSWARWRAWRLCSTRSALPTSTPTPGPGLELQVIAAVVVGGVAVSGGRGTLAGSLIGVALLGSIGPALVFLGANLPAGLEWFGKPQWEKAIQGLIILLAVASDAFYREGRG